MVGSFLRPREELKEMNFLIWHTQILKWVAAVFLIFNLTCIALSIYDRYIGSAIKKHLGCIYVAKFQSNVKSCFAQCIRCIDVGHLVLDNLLDVG